MALNLVHSFSLWMKGTQNLMGTLGNSTILLSVVSGLFLSNIYKVFASLSRCQAS